MKTPPLDFSRALPRTAADNPTTAAGFGVATLRGIGQVMLQNNALTGCLFLFGIAIAAPLLAFSALLGSAVATATALLLGAKHSRVRDGLFGFNGTLTAIALLVFLEPTPLAWGCVIFATAGSTIVMAALTGLLTPWRTPALTAPFVIVSWCFFLSTARLGRLVPTGLLPAADLPRATAVEGVVGASTFVGGVFHGVSQVFFLESRIAGAIFLLGLVISSRRAALAALLGSFVGFLTAWVMGAAEPSIHAGIYGFNSALVAIALGSVFYMPGRLAAAITLFASFATPIAAAAISAATQPFGLPGLTMPFVLVSWMFLWAGTSFPGLARVAASEE